MSKDASIWLAEKKMVLEKSGNVRFAVHIKPGKRKTETTGTDENDDLMVSVAAQPVENKANLALVKYIAKLFSVPKSTVHIVSGLTHRQKIIEVSTPLDLTS